MSEQPPPNDPLRAFTFAGRLLVIATLIVAGGVFYWNVMFVNGIAAQRLSSTWRLQATARWRFQIQHLRRAVPEQYRWAAARR